MNDVALFTIIHSQAINNKKNLPIVECSVDTVAGTATEAFVAGTSGSVAGTTLSPVVVGTNP